MSQYFRIGMKRKIFLPPEGVGGGYISALIRSIVKALSIKRYKRREKGNGCKTGVLSIYNCVKDTTTDPRLESRFVIELAVYKSKDG